ncbi:MAG: diaminopimelate decarboxylase [Planctomycetota bacterium]
MSQSSRISPLGVGDIYRAAFQSGLLAENAKSFLVHDLSWMKSRINEFQDAFPKAKHALAIKANPLVKVLRVAVECGFGLEAASIEEVALATAAGCPANRIVFDSPAKTHQEIEETLRRGVVLNIDNLTELARVESILGTSHPAAPIGLRINTEVGAGRISQTSVAGTGSKFGVSISRERHEIVAAFSRNPWLNAIHTHVGSQGCGLHLLVDAIAKVEQLRLEVQAATRRAIPNVNIGGGLPAAYLQGDTPPTPREYADALRSRVPSLFRPDVTLFTEFGRAIQANSGAAFSRIESVRPLGNGEQLVVIHLGADLLLRPVYRSDDWKHEFLCLDPSGDVIVDDVEPTTIAGPLCFAGDILGRGVPLPRPREGDWIAICDTGAYTLSMWSRHCNRAIPAVLGYDEGSVTMLRNAETPQDIVRMWS